MGIRDNARVIQADQANKLAKKQLAELQRQSASQSHRPASQSTSGDLTAEVRQLNAGVQAIAANLARLVEILDHDNRPSQ